MIRSLVIIAIVDEDCVLALEAEGQPPVAADSDRPVTRKIALKLVQMPAGKVHCQRLARPIQHQELIFEFLRMGGLNAGL
jgi:hypothetical protein